MGAVPGSPEPLTENAHDQASVPNFAWQTLPPSRPQHTGVGVGATWAHPEREARAGCALEADTSRGNKDPGVRWGLGGVRGGVVVRDY